MNNQIQTFLKLTSDKNIMFSPMSLNTVLAILAEVAVDDTKEKILRYLEKDYSVQLPLLARSLRFDENNIFSFSNGIWIEEKYQVSNNIKKIQNLYNTDIVRSNFSNINYLANDINYYVESKTLGMISKIVEPNDIKGSDSVIANTVYFQSAWKDSLHKIQDIFEDFNGEKKLTSFVAGGADGYMETDSAIGFSKYYENNLEFIGILPKENIEDVNIEELLNTKSYQYNVSIEMPILNFETKIELTSLLPSLGLEDLLTGRNMTGLYADKTAFHISKLMQNTNIELDENGTKASAATVSVNIRNCACFMKEMKEVNLNRPFLFLIYHNKTNEIIFIGKVISV